MQAQEQGINALEQRVLHNVPTNRIKRDTLNQTNGALHCVRHQPVLNSVHPCLGDELEHQRTQLAREPHYGKRGGNVRVLYRRKGSLHIHKHLVHWSVRKLFILSDG
jgi:hypothetical protein